MSLRPSLRRAALALAAAGALFVPAPTAAAASTSTTSTNWAGYAVTGKTFKRVSGAWVQPAIDCTTTGATDAYSATWVGLGGYSAAAQALEQVGVDADCSSAGTPTYYAWYELVPAPAVKVALKVSGGDTVTTSVVVTGTDVVRAIVSLKAVVRATVELVSIAIVCLAPARNPMLLIHQVPSGCT